MGVVLSESCIRKILMRNGFRWLPRREKNKYSKKVMIERASFAQRVLALNPKALRQSLA